MDPGALAIPLDRPASLRTVPNDPSPGDTGQPQPNDKRMTTSTDACAQPSGAYRADSAVELIDQLVTDPNALPSSAGVAIEVLRVVEDPTASLADLERTVTADPALTARILRMVNAGMFGVYQEVSSIQRASILLGRRAVRVLALSFSLLETLPRSGSRRGFSYPQYWQRSIIGAIVARRLALRVDPELADDTYLARVAGPHRSRRAGRTTTRHLRRRVHRRRSLAVRGHRARRDRLLQR